MIEAPAQYLRDIRGIDPVGWWPPAPGWWLIAMLGLALLGAGFWLWRMREYSAVRWRADALQRLKILRRQLHNLEPKAVASELSELLRRIAIARGGRESCAGLVGEEWLNWLSQADPTAFDWKGRGQILLELPYAPPQTQGEHKELVDLIDAAIRWVTTSTQDSSLRANSRDDNGSQQSLTATHV